MNFERDGEQKHTTIFNSFDKCIAESFSLGKVDLIPINISVWVTEAETTVN